MVTGAHRTGVTARQRGALLAGALALAACRSTSVPGGDAAPAPAPPPPPETAPASGGPRLGPPPAVDIAGALARCEVALRGPMLDLGSPAADGLLDGWSFADTRAAEVEHDGATWLEVTNKTLTARLWLDEPSPVFASARIQGGAARSATVAVDGHLLGQWALARGTSRIGTTRATSAPLAAGPHTVQLRFGGAARASGDALAQLDWVRLGTPEEAAGTWAAPTLREVLADVALGNVPHRSVALRRQARVRCPVPLGAGARLRVALGFGGPGEGQADIRVVRDGEAPVTLRSERVLGGDKATWTPVEIPLDAWAGQIVGIELAAPAATPKGRVLFGDPRIVPPETTAEAPPPARLVVVLVLDGLDPERFPPATPGAPLPALAELARTGTVYEHHRAPTTLVAGAMASLLTGLSPRAHGVTDAGARLRAGVTTIAGAARDGSVQTAMFTGVPTTSAAFGFARGWDAYVAHSPVEGVASVAPIAEATEWIASRMHDARARGLVVVHARGGHPPWQVLPSELATLAPPDYAGPLDPRRASQVLARARAKGSHVKLGDADRVRMAALYDAALAGHDRAISALLDALRQESLLDRTLLVVTGDVSTDLAHRVPFGDGEELSERLLEVPLLVRFPGGHYGGVHVQNATTTVDVARTALASLGLGVPDGFEGKDLRALAAGIADAAGRPTWATLGPRWSMRWGPVALSGGESRAPALCDLGSDPACATDATEARPLAARMLWRAAWDAEQRARRLAGPREPATIDPATSAALQVWGE